MSPVNRSVNVLHQKISFIINAASISGECNENIDTISMCSNMEIMFSLQIKCFQPLQKILCAILAPIKNFKLPNNSFVVLSITSY